MSSSLKIIAAKPNPTGKDRNSSGPLARQLQGEWVDLRNDGPTVVSLASKHLSHQPFDSSCRPTGQPQIYWSGDATITLQPGQTVRIHTGRKADAWQADSEDATGATYHSYAESANFVLNNRCGDTIGVWWKDAQGNWVTTGRDHASYSPSPAEGRILRRQGDYLI
jgi:hypothetical protein